MSLVIWIPLTLSIGVGLLGLCGLFLVACEKI